MVGAAAMMGAAMQAPLASLALALELTHSGFQIMVPMLAATVIATVVARYIDGYSIYSARLPPQRGGPPRRRPVWPAYHRGRRHRRPGHRVMVTGRRGMRGSRHGPTDREQATADGDRTARRTA